MSSPSINVSSSNKDIVLSILFVIIFIIIITVSIFLGFKYFGTASNSLEYEHSKVMVKAEEVLTDSYFCDLINRHLINANAEINNWWSSNYWIEMNQEYKDLLTEKNEEYCSI